MSPDEPAALDLSTAQIGRLADGETVRTAGGAEISLEVNAAPFLDRLEAIRDRAIALEHARICAGLVWPYRRPAPVHWRLSQGEAAE